MCTFLTLPILLVVCPTAAIAHVEVVAGAEAKRQMETTSPILPPTVGYFHFVSSYR